MAPVHRAVQHCRGVGEHRLRLAPHHTASPAHLSLTDYGVTFATNPNRGLYVSFLEPVRAIEPAGLLRHPAATVTVAEPEALAAARAVILRQLGDGAAWKTDDQQELPIHD